MKADGTGLIRDPRGGEFEETSPSFNTWRGNQDGAAMFQRKGHGDRTWNALQWLEDYGHGGQGMTRKEAAALLISRAGIVDTGAPRGEVPRPCRQAAPRLGAVLRERQGKDYAADPPGAVKGWERLTAEGGEGAAREMLESRGLLPALPSGLLEAYRVPPGKPRKLSPLITADALALVIRGPEGAPLAVKYRNAGSKAELKEAGRDRYVYPRGHKGLPAWCTPGLTAPEVRAEVWTEGELNGVAFALALGAAGLSGSVGVQGMAGADGNPHVRHALTGRDVFIYADPDPAGDGARTRWARLALDLGAVPYLLPPLEEGSPERNAAAFLGAHGPEALGAWLQDRMGQAVPWQDPEPPAEDGETFGEGFTAWPYGVRGGQVVKLKRDPDAEDGEERRPLLGFTARISAEVTRDSGDGSPVTVFLLEGQTPEGRPLKPLEVPAGKFSGMTWPLENWGADGFLYPGSSTKDEARAALLSLSRAAGMDRRTVYTHTGWVDLPEHGPVFLSAGACIGAAGTVPGVGVSLLGKLRHYALPDPPEGDAEAEAVRASLGLLTLGPDALTFPLLAAVYRAPLGNVRFSEWLAGRTGWGKSTYAALLQSHYGAGWVEHFPPADFQSIDNALTLGAFLAKDVLFVADDFKPGGAKAEQDRVHAALSRFLSSAGNGAGRDRMTADALTVRTGYYPRGLVLATAEELPRKHSDVARTVALDVPGPLFGPGGPADGAARFDEARELAGSGVYARAMSGYLRFLAEHHAELTGPALASRVTATARALTSGQGTGTHGRTAHNAAELLEGWRTFLTYARECGAVTDAEGMNLWRRAVEALRGTVAGQAAHLEAADPVARFLPLLGGLLRSGAVYLRDADMGGVPGSEEGPDNPDAPGAGWRWRSYGDPAEEKGLWETRPGAVPVGWLAHAEGGTWALLEAGAYAQVNRAAEGEGYGLPSPRMLWQGLRDRHAPRGEMLAEKGKATYRRSVYGCGPKERIPLYNIVWPLPLEKRDRGTSDAETPSDTAFSGVPFLFLDKGHLKRKGTPSPEMLSETAKNGVPFLPSVENAEQDGVSEPEELEADAFEVFTV